MAEPAIGFIGTGVLGAPICQRLVDAGFAVTVWNRTAAKTAEVVAAGATAADGPAAVAAASDIVLLCVTDADAVAAVALDDGGLADGGAAGKLVVDLSSIDPVRAPEIAAALVARCGMGWIDAPVSGGAAGARRGELIVMAGGTGDDIARAEPVFAAFTQRVTHMGPVGAGQMTKVCNQMIIGVTLAGIAEALNLARRAGVDAARLPDALAGGWADSTVLQDHGRRMAAADFSGPGTAAIMMKDMATVLEVGRRTATPLPATSLVAALYELSIAQGHSDAGQIGLIRLFADGPL